jgi:cytochrome d ubiquinol oxidase subunit I
LIGISLGLYLSLYAALLVAYISVLFHLMHKASKGELDAGIGVLPEGKAHEGVRA